MLLKIIMGDRWHDGHGKTQTFILESNVDPFVLEESHAKIKEKTGIDFDKICSKYEDSSIYKDTIDKAEALGYSFDDALNKDIFGESTKENSIIVYPEGLLDLWLFLIKTIDDTILLSVVDLVTPDIRMGYGVM